MWRLGGGGYYDLKEKRGRGRNENYIFCGELMSFPEVEP